MKNIDKLLEEYSKNELPHFPIEENQLRSILSEVDSKQTLTKKLFNKRNGAIIMTTFSLILFFLFNSIFNVFNADKTVTDRTSSIENQIATVSFSKLDDGSYPTVFSNGGSKPEAADNKSNLTVNQTKTQYGKNNNRSEVIRNDINTKITKPENVNSVTTQRLIELTEKNQATIDDLVPDKRALNKYRFPIIRLTDEELKKIGIEHIGATYRIYCESEYSREHGNYNGELLKAGYPDSGISRSYSTINSEGNVEKEYIRYSGWNLKSTTNICPADLHLLRKDGKIITGETRMSWYAPTCDIYADYISSEMFKEINASISSIDSNNVIVNLKIDGFDGTTIDEMTDNNEDASNTEIKNNEYFIEVDKDKYPLANSFVPLYIKSNINGLQIKTILWYATTPQLVACLPERYSTFITEEMSIKSKFTYDKPITPKKKKTPVVDSVKPIAGINCLELTQDELDRIGVLRKDGKYSCQFEYVLKMNEVDSKYKPQLYEWGYDTTLPHLQVRSEILIDTVTISPLPVRYNGWDHTKFSNTLPISVMKDAYWWEFDGVKNVPHQVTNIQINDYSHYQDDSLITDKEWFDDNGNSRIARLLPVCLVLGDKYNSDSLKRFYADIKIWFYINTEFANLLPDRYKIPLLNELEVITSIENGSMTLEQGCNSLKGESFFDICSVGSHNFCQFDCFPNPLTDNTVNVRLRSNKKLDVSIKIHNYKGICVKQYNEKFTIQEGYNAFTLDGINLDNGIYLLNITSDEGDNVIQKIIVNK